MSKLVEDDCSDDDILYSINSDISDIDSDDVYEVVNHLMMNVLQVVKVNVNHGQEKC